MRVPVILYDFRVLKLQNNGPTVLVSDFSMLFLDCLDPQKSGSESVPLETCLTGETCQLLVKNIEDRGLVTQTITRQCGPVNSELEEPGSSLLFEVESKSNSCSYGNSCEGQENG